MSVHTELDEAEVKDLLSLYDIGALLRLKPTRGFSANSNYLLDTDQGQYLLRVHEGRRFRDLVYEKEVLLFLAEVELSFQVPRLIPNIIKGNMT